MVSDPWLSSVAAWKTHNKADEFTERPQAPGGMREQENNQQRDGVMRRNCCYLPLKKKKKSTVKAGLCFFLLHNYTLIMVQL